MSYTKDGRWIMSWGVSAKDKSKLVPFLDGYGMAADLEPVDADADFSARNIPGTTDADEASNHTLEVIQRFVRAYRYDHVPWRARAGCRAAVGAGPQAARKTPPTRIGCSARPSPRSSIPSWGRNFLYPTSKWLSTATAWQPGTRPPFLGEHSSEILSRPRRAAAPCRGAQVFDRRAAIAARQAVRAPGCPASSISPGSSPRRAERASSRRSAPNASRSSGKANPDTRLAAMAPIGGRAARERATAPLPGVADPDMGGQFNNKNAGKRGLSLNVRHPKGLAIAKELIRLSDVVAEGFSPGVLDRLGLGYDVLRSIRPDIIYIQQSGMGSAGTYGRFRTVGPVAASFAGNTDMSGLPEPAMPAGWGYSYLDWAGAHGFSLAILGALYHRERTGEGQWIDSSQCEAGNFQTAVPVLDWSANAAHLATDRQSLPLQAGGAARRLSMPRRRSLGRHRLLRRNRMDRADRSGQPRRAAPRPALRDARPIGCITRTRWTPRSAPGPRRPMPMTRWSGSSGPAFAAGACQTAADRWRP
ncbi:MAG: CoA transferase [Sphingomonas sp.]